MTIPRSSSGQEKNFVSEEPHTSLSTSYTPPRARGQERKKRLFDCRACLVAAEVQAFSYRTPIANLRARCWGIEAELNLRLGKLETLRAAVVIGAAAFLFT